MRDRSVAPPPRLPSGVAVAEILRTGSAGIDKFRLLLIGVVISGLWKLVLATELINQPGVLMN